MPDESAKRSAAQPNAVVVALLTALAYAVTGWFALRLSLGPGWASPLYPSAGIALAATLAYGLPGALGAAVGATAVNTLHASNIGSAGAALTIGIPLLIGIGAACQALLARWLLRRAVGLPLTLRGPSEVLQFSLRGAIVACLLNATLSTTGLVLAGGIAPPDHLFAWWTWWAGDALGVLVGAPIALAVIGQPRDDWATRRLNVGLPMALATVLLALATLVFHRFEQRRLVETFGHSADAAFEAVSEQLDESIYALRALHGMVASHAEPRRVPLRPAVDWWFEHATGLRALGFSERVARSQIGEFEAAARSAGLAGYRVFDRVEGAALAAADSHVVAIRSIEPLAGNAAALGVNALSIPAARTALLEAVRSGKDVATEGFRVTQAKNPDEIGVVIYRAIYGGRAETPEERLAQFRGVVFATLDLGQAVQRVMTRLQGPLQWCMVDRPPTGPGQRLAGPRDCERVTAAEFSTTRPLEFAGRRWELRLWSSAKALPGGQHTGSWLFSVVGLAATATLGMLLLVVTGRARRIELAVEERTQALSTEVRERRGAEIALRDSEQRLRSILDHVPIGVVFLDPQGRILDHNPSMSRMLGHTGDALRGMSVRDLDHPADHPAHLEASRALFDGRVDVVTRQMRLRRADGSYLDVRALLTALRDEAGRPRRLVGVVEDITEHLRLAETERARDAAEAASRAKSEFVSRMSHELRTPLNAMLGFAQLLGMDRRPTLAAHQAAWATQIQHAGWHLLDMINDTLDLSRIEAGLVELQPVPLDLEPMAEACIALLSGAADKRGIRVSLQLDPHASRALADETRLKQVLTNLLSNAIKYNRERGAVVVTTRPLNDDMLEIEVRDTGIGMSASQLAGLFQPYNRLGRESSGIEGTGIGLVISRRLAELMGGTLQAASEEGHGSVFRLRMPRARFTDTGTLVDSLDGPTVPQYRRRLVHYIEDNETNVEVMRGILAQRPQISLEVSASGLDGLAAVRRHRPDLILLDMHLPDLEGLELLRHLKSDDRVADIPVVVVSADATPQRVEEALTLGALNYVTKPVDVTQFLLLLDATLSDMSTRWS